MSTGWVASGTKSLVGTTEAGNLLEDLATRDNFSTRVGYQAGQKNAGGIGNTIFGYQAALETTLANNFIGIGRYAGKDNQGSEVIYIGNNTGGRTGQHNVFVGHDTGIEAGGSEYNVVTGNLAFRNYTGNFNVSVGYANNRGEVPRLSWNNTSIGASTQVYGLYNAAVGAYSRTGDCSNAYLLGVNLSNSGSSTVLLGTNITNSGNRSFIVGHGTGVAPLDNRLDDYINIMGVIQGTKTGGVSITSCNTTLSSPGGAGVSVSNNTVTVMGQAAFSCNVNVASNLTIQGGLLAQGDVNFEGGSVLMENGLQALGLTELSELQVHEIAEFRDDILAGGDLEVDGRLVVKSNVQLRGAEVSVSGQLVTQGAATFNDRLVAQGVATFNDRVVTQGVATFNDRVVVQGSTVLNDQLTTHGTASFRSNVTVDGMLAAASIDVRQHAQLCNATVTGRLRLEGDLDVGCRPLHICTLHTDTLVASNTARFLEGFRAEGPAIFSELVDFKRGFMVSNACLFNSDLYVTGLLDVKSHAVLHSDAHVLGDLDVHGSAFVHSNLSVNGALSVSAATQFSEGVKFTGPAEFTSARFSQGLESLGPAVFQGGMTVSAPATFSNQLTVTGPVNASGNVSIGGKLLASNEATFLGGGTFRSNVQFLEQVTLAGPTSAAGPVWFDSNVVFSRGLTACNTVVFTGNVDVLDTLRSKEVSTEVLSVSSNLRFNGSNLLQVLTSANNNSSSSSNWATGSFASNVYIKSTLTVDGVTRINDDLYVKTLYADFLSTRTRLSIDQVGGFNNDITFQKDATVLGNQYVAGDLFANGDLELTGNMRAFGYLGLGTESNAWTISVNGWNLDFTSIRGTQVTFSEMFETGPLNHTGQHRCRLRLPSGHTTVSLGSVVCSTGHYFNNLKDRPDVHMDDCVPVVRLATRRRDRRVFGVVSSLDRDTLHHHFRVGYMQFRVPKREPLVRRGGGARTQVDVVVNQTGEGCILVCGEQGRVRNGDLLCMSSIPGVCMRQRDAVLRSYTCAKATCDQPAASWVLHRVDLIGCLYKF
jgi:hypothetical protein